MGVDTEIIAGYGIEIYEKSEVELALKFLQEQYPDTEFIDDTENDLFFTVYEDCMEDASTDIVILLKSSVKNENIKTGGKLGLSFDYPEIEEITDNDIKQMDELYKLLINKLAPNNEYTSICEPRKLIYLRFT